MAKPLQDLLQYATAANHKRGLLSKLLLQRTQLLPPLSSELRQLLHTATLKNEPFAANSDLVDPNLGKWKQPLLDPILGILNPNNLEKLLITLTNGIHLNDMARIEKFLRNRILYTTPNFNSQITHSSNIKINDNVPIYNSQIYFNLLQFFIRRSSREIPQIIFKMKSNGVSLNADVINILLAASLGSKIKSKAPFNSEVDDELYQSLRDTLDLLNIMHAEPNMTTLFLIYSSLPIESEERLNLKEFIVKNDFSNTSEWTFLCLLEAQRCLEKINNPTMTQQVKNKYYQIGLKSLNSIPFTKSDSLIDALSVKSIRKAYLNSQHKSPIVFNTMIQSHLLPTHSKKFFNEFKRAITIVNCLQSKNSNCKKSINITNQYSIGKNWKPSLTGSTGTILLKAARIINYDLWIRSINWIFQNEGKIGWNVLYGAIQDIIKKSSSDSKLLILFTIKFILQKAKLCKLNNDQLISFRRWDDIYWEMQNSVDFVWGVKFGVKRNEKVVNGLNKFIKELKSDSIKINNSKILIDSVESNNEFYNELINNGLISTDISKVTPFEEKVLENLSQLKLFKNRKFIYNVETEPIWIDLKSGENKESNQEKDKFDEIWMSEIVKSCLERYK